MKTNRFHLIPSITVVLAFAAFTSGWTLRGSAAVDAMVEADYKLNVVYKRLMASIPSAAQKDKLKAAQRAWLAWMEAEDAFRSALEGTSKAGLFVRVELLESRSAQLEGVLQSR